jgi:hypothetical protein
MPKKIPLSVDLPTPKAEISRKNPLHLISKIPIPNNRQLGTSTAIALKTVAEAIEKPYKWIQLIDHYQYNSNGDMHLFYTAKTICSRLELQQMYFKVIGTKYFIAFGDPKK